jgi:choline dehydrogenase-like flavoprotein
VTIWVSSDGSRITLLTRFIDYEILREGLKLARKLGETAPVSSTLTNETSPGSSVQTDDQWLEWIIESAGTEYHPSSSCAMLPRDQGGVVDANLRVYGLANVRVADASVPPIALSTHLMASTYGVAEQAGIIIRKYYDGALATTAPSFSSTSANTTSTASSSKHANGSTSSSRYPVSILAWLPLAIAVILSFGGLN